MKHIQTLSDAEKAMRAMYKAATDSTPMVANASHMASIRKIVEFTRQKDELSAEISKEVGALMGVMQGHSAMVDDKGRPVITWRNGNEKKTIDWDGIVVELNISPSVLARFTRTSAGTRVFRIEDDNITD